MRAAELDAKLNSVQIIDTRPADQFAGGRIPGAIYLDLWALSLNDTDPAPARAFFWSISHYLTAHGIDPRRPVVLYEADEVGPRAARAFWFLEYFGHSDVRVLDGGFKAWTAAGLRVETGPGRPLDQGSWPDDHSTPRREDIVAGWRDVFACAGAPAQRHDCAILDTRSEGEYHGTTVRAKRGGAIPHAIHIEWKDNLRPDGMFKGADELRRAMVGDVVTYVVNRNINFTNVCFVGCKFCAFSRGPREDDAYFLTLEDVARRTREARQRGATEVCIQGGLPRELPPFYYRDILRAVKSAVPDMHTHAFSPMPQSTIAGVVLWMRGTVAGTIVAGMAALTIAAAVAAWI